MCTSMISKRLSKIGAPVLLMLGVIACEPIEQTADAVTTASPTTSEILDRKEALIEAIDSAINLEMRDNHIPGVGLVVVHDGIEHCTSRRFKSMHHRARLVLFPNRGS